MTDTQKASPTDTKEHTLPVWELIALTGLMFGVTAFAMDTLVPAGTHIFNAFGLQDANSLAAIFSVQLIGIAVSAPFFGPLADSIGRKATLLLGCVIFLIASMCCIAVDSYGLLLFFRFVQGFGAGATRNVSLAVLRDLFGGNRMGRITSFSTSLIAIIPLTMPALSLYLLDIYGWTVPFYMQIVYIAVVLVWISIRLPETLPKEYRRKLNFDKIKSGFTEVISDSLALSYTAAIGCMMSLMTIYVSTVQRVMVGYFEFGSNFTYVFGGTVVGLSVGALLGARLTLKLELGTIAWHGLCACTLATATYASIAHLGLDNVYLYIACQFIMLLSWGLVGPSLQTLSFDHLNHIGGTAAAITGAGSLIFSGILSYIIVQFFDGSPGSVIAWSVPLLVVGLLMVVRGNRIRRARINKQK